MQKLSDAVVKAILKEVKTNPKYLPSLEEWIDFGLNVSDLFMRCYIGYWACGRKTSKGWRLLGDEGKIVGMLNPKSMEAAYVYGVFMCGQFDWYKECPRADGNTYDRAIQMAVFGEIRYA